MKPLRAQILLAVFFVINMALASYAQENATDSVHSNRLKHHKLKFTARIHSLGIFGYGGMIANANPSIDVSAAYTRKHWGCFLLKAVDVYDLHSPYNFSLAMINAPLRVTKKLTISPYAGFVIVQREQLADQESDGMIFLVNTYKQSDHLAMEYAARFSNTFIDREFFDWLNRFRVVYSYHHFDVTTTLWHNNRVFDQSAHTSLGFTIGYNRIEFSDHIKLSTTITGIKMTGSTLENDPSKCSGLSLTIAATFE